MLREKILIHLSKDPEDFGQLCQYCGLKKILTEMYLCRNYLKKNISDIFTDLKTLAMGYLYIIKIQSQL